MYHTRSSSVIDKENKEAASSRMLTRQQSSSNLLPRTPSKQHIQGQQHQQPLKAAGVPGTPSLPAKQTTIAPSTPTSHSILRAKTNQQLPATPSAHGSKVTNHHTPKKGGLARTFSAATVNSIAAENNTENHLRSPDLAAIAAADTRRKSITRRGSSVRERLIVHRDEPSVDSLETSATNVAAMPPHETTSSSSLAAATPESLRRSSHRKKSLIRREKAVEQAKENATTTLAMERSQASLDKIVVGEGKTESKRRALSKEDDEVEIEYCPPRQQEQPYECEVQIDKRVFDLHPPAFAYYVSTIKDFDLPLPSFEPAETRRRPGLATMDMPTIDTATKDIKLRKRPGSKGGLSSNEKTTDDAERARGDEIAELEATLHPEGSPSATILGIADLHDNSKTLPPFDGFLFDVDDSGDDQNAATETVPGTSLEPSEPSETAVKSTVKPTMKPTKPERIIKPPKKKAASKPAASIGKTPPKLALERTLRPASSSTSGSAMTATPAGTEKASAASSSFRAPATTTTSPTTSTDKTLLKDIGLEDLEDTSKVETSFSDFQFDL
ncbi:hypothetical protein BGZ73_005934 [Actinomortierella ambigua]|nr:hypothetical protein BGZ73_005934 [Actinomortierella ambigua]